MKKFKDYIGKGEFEVYIINKTSLKVGKRNIEIKKDGALIDNKRSQFLYLTDWLSGVLEVDKAFGYYLNEEEAKTDLLKYTLAEKEVLVKRLEKIEKALKELE